MITKEQYSPHDLLPIKHPSNECNKDDPTFFYTKVIEPLIPTIIRITNNGIPIDLSKVEELENTVSEVIDKVHDKLRNNHIMIEFLTEVSKDSKKIKQEELQNKKKNPEDFIKTFDIKNKIHRSYVINTWLSLQNKNDMQLSEWSIKDLQKLNQIIEDKFLQNLLDKKLESWMQNYIDAGMLNLAVDKSNTYNKNKVNSKIEELNKTDIIIKFNPGSPTQLRNLFDYLGIKSENETPTGNGKWDRNELLRLQKLFNVMIENKE